MGTQFSPLESFSAATGIGVATVNTSGEMSFSSSVYESMNKTVLSLFSVLGCTRAEHETIVDSVYQSRRFGGRYNFIAPSGLVYCASPFTGSLNKTELGAVAGPFLMTDYDDYIAIDVPSHNKQNPDDIIALYELTRTIPLRTPVEARAICEMLALCTEHCNSSLGPFGVPYNEALAASIKHMDEISKAVSYIKQNYMKKIKLQDIAEHVFFSATYFAKVFRDEMGLTPGNYITATRIDESKRLLRDSEVSIIDIPEMVGLESQSYFTRIFKKAEGITPGEFRRNAIRERRGS
jgi:AraC-like DNA-binding protein